jgi:hypothetical protein
MMAVVKPLTGRLREARTTAMAITAKNSNHASVATILTILATSMEFPPQRTRYWAAMLNYLELTQLEEGWGCLGGLRPPKHPQFPPELRKSYYS